MKTLLSMILSGIMAVTAASAPAENTASATVDRIEENRWAVLEICTNGEYWKMLDVPMENFTTAKSEGETFSLNVTSGKFYTTLQANTSEGREVTLYQFRSDDNSVWWLLTAEEIGYIPDNETEYTLIYYDNETTAENKPCDCPAEWECECELYDDIFIGITAEN